MVSPLKVCLLKSLEKLTEDELGAFKDQLKGIQIKEGYERIPAKDLTGAGRNALADLLLRYYGEDYGTDVALEVLKSVKKKGPVKIRAAELSKYVPKALKTVKKRVPAERHAAQPYKYEEHFVERYQGELIRRISKVPEVLHRLIGVALTPEQYKDIMSEPIHFLRMEKLYALVPGWKKECKDHLFQVLQETNRPLIAELNEEHFIDRHKAELIEQISKLDDIMKTLCHRLDLEQYRAIMAEETDRQKMEKLFKVMSSSPRRLKNFVCFVLKRTNRRLFLELEAIDLLRRQKEELLRRVSGVQRVLDGLKGAVLEPHQYERLTAMDTDWQKMKALYELMPSWDRVRKYLVYQTLMEENASLFREIAGMSEPGKPVVSPGTEEHFIERHQEELIRRVVGVHILLDNLQWNDLITCEQRLEMNGTNQEQMRKLYEPVASWTTADKDQLQHILAKTNRRLISQLAGGHFVNRHWEELIEHVEEVPLSKLCGFMLSEEYETVISCSTEKMQMEALFQLEQKWSRQQKDQLYQVLAETNSRVIEELEEEHFVEKHQEELIHRVSRMDAVLRRLQDQCSQTENQDLSLQSDQQKMEWLYELVPMWGRKLKDSLYRVLEKTNAPLIAELKEGHFVERHKKELLQRVTGVENVVQGLQHKTISHHLYLETLKKMTDEGKMSILYKVVPGWNGDWKDHLYQALRTTNKNLVEELEGRKSSKEGLIPDPLAEEKCYLCVREKGFPEVQPELLLEGERKTYRLHLPKAGNVFCSATELKFETRAAVTIEYNHDSWNKHLNEAEMGDWMVAGPLFDIRVEPVGEVTAVHLPLFMCCKEKNIDTEIKIAHFVDGQMTLEEPTRITPFHVVLDNPTFSLLGLLLKPCQKLFKFIPIHSVVQLYQVHNTNVTTMFHLYVVPNDLSLTKAIEDMEKKRHSVQLSKHPQTDEPLHFGSHYVVSSSEDVRINPNMLEFSYQGLEQLQSCVEIRVRNRARVQISLKKKKNLRCVWEAWLEADEVPILLNPSVSITRTREKDKAPTETLYPIQDHLMTILEDLEKEDLRRFKYKLNEFPINKGYKNIPRGQLEEADPLVLSHKLLSYYDEDYSVKVTAEVLKAINLKQHAKKLLALLGEDGSKQEQEVEIQKELEQKKFSAKGKIKALKDLLAKLKLENQKSKRLCLREVLEISARSLNQSPAQALGDLPWQFLLKLLALNTTARSTSLEQGTSDSPGTQEIRIDEIVLFTDEMDARDSVNPLDVLCAVLLCSDSFLQQEILLNMSMCQFALPFLLPPLETSKCTLMLWAMRDIVKKWRPHSLAESKGFREESLVLTSMPTVSFVRMGTSSFSKSKLLNELLSPSQQHHDFFIHQDMEGGNVPREIADGLVEIACYFPGGQKNSDLFPEPITVANLRGDVESHWVQFSFLAEISSAVFIFAESIGEKEYALLSSLKESSTQYYFILECHGKESIETCDFLIKLTPVLNFNSSHIIVKDFKINKARFVGMLQSTIKKIISSPSKMMCVQEMASVAQKHEIQVDEDCQDCQTALRCAAKITENLKDITDYKTEMFKLQGDLLKNVAKVEKELSRMARQRSKPLEQYKSELKGKLFELRKQQNECELSIGLTDFIRGIEHSKSTEKHYFLKWMKFKLDHIAREAHFKLSTEYKEEFKGIQTVAKVNGQPTCCSLGIEHFMRELGQFYEAEYSMVKAGTIAKAKRQFVHFPRIVADLMLEGFPLELIDGDASNIPLQWITDVLTELHNKLRGRSKMLVITVVGVQSTGKSTLLNTVFGLQFAVSNGLCTRGAFMTLLNVKEDLTEELGCDFILVIDTEGLKAPEMAKLEDSYQHDSKLATLVVGLSDITIVNMAMENAIAMKDILQIVTHAFLRMKEIGQNISCQFVHQNVSDVGAHDLNMRDRKYLLEQLNEMTQAAAKMEKLDRDIKFSDIMDYDSEMHNWYIPSLWHGVPPMAPVNRGYSEKVFELKKFLFEFIRNRSLERTPKDIPQFTERLKSLWNAVKHENFIFSFRNSLVAEAYNRLSMKFSEWDRAFRREIHLWVSEQETAIQNASSDELHSCSWQCELQEKLSFGELQILESLKQYFESGATNLHLTEQYRKDFIRRANSLKCELENYYCTNFREAIPIKESFTTSMLNTQDQRK